MTDPTSDKNRWLIYGANGYTGELTAREAVDRGEAPILAGRSREPVESLARELKLEARVFDLGEPGATQEALWDVSAVLHCAGPFVLTSRPMVDACLATGTHYLDITGEIAVFEAVLARHQEALHAGMALLPGVGFDVVPTDTVAARLAQALPEATHLDLAFAGSSAEWSRGTLKTMIESLPAMGAIRQDGRIRPVPPGFATREIDFPGLGRRHAVTVPWGDVSTAYHSTGIPNIRVFTGMPPKAVKRLRLVRPLLPILGWKPVKRLLQKWVERTVTGPDRTTRETARMHVWGETRTPAGGTAVAGVETPEGYRFTAQAGVECTLRAVAGQVDPGAWTPSKAFGADFAGTLDGVTVEEVVKR